MEDKYMHNIFLEEVRNNSRIIANNTNEEKEKELIAVYEQISKMSLTARKEGLLALDEACQKMNPLSNESIFIKCLTLIIDGTDPNILKDIAYSKYFASLVEGYDGLIWLMYIEGSLAIQAGENPVVIEARLKAMLPPSIEEQIFQIEKLREEERKKQIELQKIDKRIAALCSENAEIDENDHTLVGETARTILKMNDVSIQEWLKHVDMGMLELTLKGLPGAARRRIFDNVSPRVAKVIIDDMENIGPVRLSDVESGCLPIMKELIRLKKRSEIIVGDTQVLEVVIDIAEKKA